MSREPHLEVLVMVKFQKKEDDFRFIGLSSIYKKFLENL